MQVHEIKVTHFGEDYAIIEVNGHEFEVAKGLGEAIVEAQEEIITHNFYSRQDFPEIGSTFEQDGKTYKVIDNTVINQSTSQLVR